MAIDNVVDREKFEEIYTKYRTLMYDVALEVLGNKEDAEDAVYQAFLYVVENIQKIDVEGSSVEEYLVGLSKEKADGLAHKKGDL